MYRLLLSVAAAAVVASSSLAFAALTTGTVKTFDAKAMILTLQDGTPYYLPQNFKDPGLKAGETVQVNWTMQGSKHEATSVTIQ
jgi:hypothetical protein